MEVCIVGHGPSLKGAGLGSKIDEKTVVRLKNCAGLLKNPEDYGTRTDVVCSSTPVVRYMVDVESPVYWAYNKRPTWNEQVLQDFKAKVKGEVYMFPETCNIWNDVFRKMGGSHPNVSTGMAAVIISLEVLKPEKLWLAGFDKILKPNVEGYISTVPSNWNDGGTKDTGHDWVSENRLLQFLAHSYKTDIERLC